MQNSKWCVGKNYVFESFVLGGAKLEIGLTEANVHKII